MQIEIGDFILIPTANQTKAEWLEQRKYGLGGSDVPILFDLSSYNSPIELFYEKLGRTTPTDLSDNSSVHYGSSFEQIVLRDSSFYNLSGDKNNHIKNFSEGNRLRSHLAFPYMIINKKFPWLICNVDGLGFYDKSITEQDLVDMVNSGVMPIPDFIVEIKTMDQMVRDKYDAGINPAYPKQVATYCVPFLDLNPDIFGMIFTFYYDRVMTHFPVYLSEVEVNEIISKSKAFHTLIQQGKTIIEDGYKLRLTEEEIDFNLSQIHPTPTGVESLGKFLSDRFLSKERTKLHDTILGSDNDVMMGLRTREIAKEMSLLKNEKNHIANSLKDKLIKANSKVIDCGNRGRISYGQRLSINIR